MNELPLKPDFVFEISWEICNKIGGIHTVVSTKANYLINELNDNYICIGPDVWKETHGNPEFIEDRYLFKAWHEQASMDGLHVRIGRWQIPGKPIAILVDFTPLFGEKDAIFTDLWLKFGLNSLSGQWDYTEPAMFGYAAARLIEHFYEYHMTAQDRIVAQFHEWMTGTGVLYLKDKIPQAGVVFTTHATVMGRSLAGHGKPLYSMLEKTDPDGKAHELGIVSKHSLEQSAARNADGFTTVSEITARECEKLLGKKPDVITPNGFNAELVPEEGLFAEKRKKARSRLIEIARGLLNQNVEDNSMLVVHSGRYEYKNKGIDLLIQSLGEINKSGADTTLLAFFLVPANQTGASSEVVKRIKAPDYNNPLTNEYTTHFLVEAEYDPILKQLKKAGLENKAEDKVKVIFVPAYLNGSDGVIDLPYYDTLIGFDLSVFPSYYEPWGYTPMESLAFRVPTITTTLSGFGKWVSGKFSNHQAAVTILNRKDNDLDDAAKELAGVLSGIWKHADAANITSDNEGYNSLAHLHMLDGRNLSADIAKEVMWGNMISHYWEVFGLALQKANGRQELFKNKKQPAKLLELPAMESMRPKWKKIQVEVHTPDVFHMLPILAKNIWWTWNYEAVDLFRSIDPRLWEKSNKNPNIMLERLSTEHYERLLADEDFMSRYKSVSSTFEAYMAAAENRSEQQIAYFSMEYGLHESIKIYSGGLGVLAGDFLKQASDDNINMVGVGLMYRYGYFSQSLSVNGEQMATYFPHNFTDMSALPVKGKDGKLLKISIAFPGRTLFARVWRIDVGRIPLYLLDTDLGENASYDRFITHQLYGGDWENRFKQEFLLGIGGIRLLDAIGHNPRVYHCNEGHAAFTGLERLREYVQDNKLSFHEATEVVRGSSLFTTHTPVPAGHDVFSEDMLRTYMPHYAERLGISWETFMGLGKINPKNPAESFSMSVLAAKLARHINGVSNIHGRVSRHMLKDLYPGYFPGELHIGHVTNGVHYGTWTAPAWQKLYSDTFGENFLHNIAHQKNWNAIYEVPDEKIWNLRNEQRTSLLDYMKKRLLSNLSRRQETPRKIYQILDAIDDKTLTIGFARRFATYKRAHLLFNDLQRLSRIVNNKKMPVQIIYAGKAHPADNAGQDLIKHIIEISRREEFRGKIIFLEDYDMELGAALTQGVDVWLNTPTRPLEASGTSGQKAVLNGVMNFSVMDGWWAEGYKEKAGWKLKEEKTYESQDFQNELDAETIYNTLESEIIPMFYGRNEQGVPEEWVQWIKKCIAEIAPQFTNKRMMDDYLNQYYNQLKDYSSRIHEDNFKLARDISRWKSKVLGAWDSVEVIEKLIISNSGKTILLGDSFKAKLVVNLNELDPKDIGVEVVFTDRPLEGEAEVVSVYEMQAANTSKKTITFSCEFPVKRTGIFNYAFRMFPKHEAMAHRQDYHLVKWL
jgi:glycogen phosphorylase/synthase